MVRQRMKYPWDRIAVGQSFFAPGRTATELASARRNAERRLGRKFMCRGEERDGVPGTRVTRLSDPPPGQPESCEGDGDGDGDGEE